MSLAIEIVEVRLFDILLFTTKDDIHKIISIY